MNSERTHEHELEREIGAALRALPAPAAPSSLAARVMTNVHAQQAAARGLRPWFAWDPRAQIGAAMAMLAAVCVCVWFSALIREWFAALAVTTPATAVRTVWSAIEPAVAGGSVYVLVMGAAAACAVAALTHVALEGTPNS